MDFASILGICALFLSVLIGAWLKLLSGRSFKSIDDAVANLTSQVNKLKASLVDVEKDVIRLTGEKNRLTDQVEQIRSASIREAQIMVNQLESIHNKIQHIDDKFDRVRESRR